MLLVIFNYCRILCDANCHDGVILSWHLINVLGHLFLTIWYLFQSLDHQIDGVGPVYLDTMVTGQKMMFFWVLLYSLNVLLLTGEVYETSLSSNKFFLCVSMFLILW